MTICRPCGTTWTGLRIAHCGSCHRTFTTVASFDRHRAGTKDRRLKAGECHDPVEVGQVQNQRGQWHKADPESRRP